MVLSAVFSLEKSHSQKNSTSIVNLRRSSCKVLFYIFSTDFRKNALVIFHENPSTVSLVLYGRTDRQANM